jgi:eukaryotic-like serine/threonine-protein kinase
MDALAQLNTSLAGRYAIDREVGRGGMATVYLARDIRHARHVALKVLNPELGAVLGVERFLSEIQVTANLQHPNLLPLFDSGGADGILYYVMPYIEGESLRTRLQREKQLPIDEALRIATSVASALDYAHRHGVVHRDLKPENILLHEGQPLVADFGIALAVSKAGGERITQTGVSLGTPHYMSPEQATGDRPIDKRSDIYSLGAVAYEMLSGDPPHTASTAQAVIAKVLTDRVRSVRLARPNVPPHVDAAIECALEKLPADRWNTAHEFAEALQGRSVSIPPAVVTPGSVARDAGRKRAVRVRLATMVPWIVAVALAIGASLVSWKLASRTHRDRTLRFLLTFPPSERMFNGIGSGRTLAMSPDGTRIVYVTVGPGMVQHLVVRTLDDVTPRVLQGTEGAMQPFFSADGQWVGFLANQQLKKVPVDGGPITVIAEIGQIFGATWTADDRIVFGQRNQLVAMPASGAMPPRPISAPDSLGSVTLRWPRTSSDGKIVLFTRWRGGLGSAGLGALSLETGEMRLLNLEGTSPLGLLDGHLLYGTSNGALFAVAFDARHVRVAGAPLLVVDRVAISPTGAAVADASPSGSIVYQSGSAASTLGMVDSSGAWRALIEEPKAYLAPRFSPDGKRIAAPIRVGGSTDIFVYSIAAGTLTRLTTQGITNDRPEWSPDGKRVLYRSERGDATGLWWQPIDFTGPAEPLILNGTGDIWEGVLSPDGKALVYRTGTLGNANIWYRQLQGDTTAKAIAATPFTEWGPRISPDGRWVVYSSDDSRSMQVYVRPLPGPGERVQVSVDGGGNPVWSRDGRKIYFLSNQRMMVATVTTSPTFAVTSRKMLFASDYFDLPGHASFDVSPDGKRFLMLKQSISGDQVIVAHNWREEMRARLNRTSQAQ